MKTLEIKLPDSPRLDPSDTLRFIAAKLFEAGKLSLGQAAKVAGMSTSSFADILADYDVSYFTYTSEDLKRDVENF